jgi:large subunit ribosomal protein L41
VPGGRKSPWSPLGLTGLLGDSVGSTVFGQQARGSKYLSRSAKKRLVLTTKRAGKGFYKGKGSTKEGYLTSKGRFVVDRLRRLELVVPDLTGFKVRFVLGRSQGSAGLKTPWRAAVAQVISANADRWPFATHVPHSLLSS